MKLDELMDEYAPKAAEQAQERAAQAQAQPKRVIVGQAPVKNGKVQHHKAPVVHIPLDTRKEVAEAVLLLLGGEDSGIKVSSINGGKSKNAKKGRRNGKA